MKRFAKFLTFCSLIAFALALAQTTLLAQEKSNSETLSLRKEIQSAIDRGLASLAKIQDTNGFWSTADQPAVTALALVAFKGDPSGSYVKNQNPILKKGYAFLEGSVHEDGSVYRKKELLTHNTALATLAFIAANDPKYDPVIRNGRNFLIGLQNDFGVKGKTDDVFDGGIGYGSKYDHSDMANTVAALEAIYYSRQMARDKGWDDAKDLNWDAAIHFLENCQNLPGHNKQPWVSGDPKNLGGFIYYPGHSMAGEETNSAGRVSFRSYGSTSYAGLLSYVYADLKPGDPRVKSVLDWLQKNYTLSENPGMGAQGLYYYYHTMSKALSLANIDELKTADGKKINWREELALKLINLQNADGSWANENNRWWEKDPALVTAYSVIALERIYRGL